MKYLAFYPGTKELLSRRSSSGILLCLILMMIVGPMLSQVPMIRLQMKGTGSYLDETILYYQEGATDGFDSEYDAYKISGPNQVPSISQEFNSTLMQINGISPVVSTFSINIKATTNITGTFTLTAVDINFLPAGTCVSLYDQLTATTVNILNGPYVFNLSNSTVGSRFVLQVTHLELPVISQLTQPACHDAMGGFIKTKGLSYGPWTYTWKDSTGAVLKTTINSNDADSLTGLNSGVYRVEMLSLSNTCYSHAQQFTIQEVSYPVVSFIAPDTILASSSVNFTPQNLSSNCQSYQWTFGNNANIYNDMQPNYAYSYAGLFATKLVGISASGCKDSITRLVRVIDIVTGVNNPNKEPVQFLSLHENQFLVKFNPQDIHELAIEILNLDGKVVYSEQFYNPTSDEKVIVNASFLKPGIYLTHIIVNKKDLVQKKILISE